MIDYKSLLGITASIIVCFSFIPYIVLILKRQVQPHIYSWFIWLITQGTAVFVLVKGGGGFWSSFGLIAGTIFIFIIFLLSFKFGTKNITKGDTVALILALVAIFIWWKLNNLVLVVLMVSLIDFIGCLPTFRKTFIDPKSEDPTYWLTQFLIGVLIILSNREINFLTSFYVGAISVFNITTLFIYYLRIKKVK